MRIVNFLLLLLIATLQVQLWAGEGSMATLWQLRQAIAAQTSEIEEFELRNRRLAAEVHDLQTGLDTIEATARRELGMVRSDETFFHVVEQ